MAQKRNNDMVQLLTPDFVRRNEIMGAWIDYTPTITSGAGVFTTVSGEGRYKVIGKTCIVNVKITITNKGTAAGTLFATLPRTASASGVTSVGSASRGLQGFCTVAPSGTTMSILAYTGATIIVNGIVYASVTYEI